MKIFISAIIKNENSSLLEWIAYHKTVGVDGFIIADNGSTDGSYELLCKLSKVASVYCFRFITDENVKPQLLAYNDCLSQAKDIADILCFIDADEFIIATNESGNIRKPLIESFKNKHVCAVAMNWANFGSNGNMFYENKLVIERFTKRAKVNFQANLNFKSAVKPKMVHHFINPHQVELTGGGYMHINGEPLITHPKHGPGVSFVVNWEPLRINHYVVKSLEEFITGKYLRGSAATLNRIKHKAYFEAHDKNDEHCDLAARLAPQVKAEMDRLQALMDALPDEAPPPAPAAQPAGLWQQGLQLARRLKPGNH